MLKRMILNVLTIGLGLPLAAGVFILCSRLSPFAVLDNVHSTKFDVSYSDLVSIMLTAVSIILAALGFVVALVAVIGWNSIGDRVSTLSHAFLSKSLSDGGDLNGMVKKSLENGGELHSLVKSEAAKIIFRGIDGIDRAVDDETDLGDPK
jgi:hypothetical protein